MKATQTTEPPAVTFVGAGIRGRVQLTIEAILCVRSADRVLFFGDLDFSAHWLEELVGARATEDIALLYHDGAVDLENYERIVSRIVDLAESGVRVAVLMPGHPRLGVSLVELVERRLDQGVAVIDGISSFDTIYTDLGREPLEAGCVVVDANRLLLYRPTLDPSFDHLIYHVCSVGTQRTHQHEPSRENQLSLLVDYLAQFFPPDRPVVLVESRLRGSIRTEATVGSLLDLLEAIDFGTTLFVLGESRPAAVADRNFAAILRATA